MLHNDIEDYVQAADNVDAYDFVEKLLKEMRKQVQDIKKCSSVTLDNGAQLSLSDGNENANHTSSIEKLLETQRDQEEGRLKG